MQRIISLYCYFQFLKSYQKNEILIFIRCFEMKYSRQIDTKNDVIENEYYSYSLLYAY